MNEVLEAFGAEVRDVDVDVVLGYEGEAPQTLSWERALSSLDSSPDQLDFARLDSDELVVTWTRTRRHLPSEPFGEDVHEVGVGAERFDEKLLIRLIRRTAVQPVRDDAGALVAQARDLLAQVPARPR